MARLAGSETHAGSEGEDLKKQESKIRPYIPESHNFLADPTNLLCSQRVRHVSIREIDSGNGDFAKGPH